MKLFKKLSALLIAMIMVVGMVVPSMAADGEGETEGPKAETPATYEQTTITVTVNGNEHTSFTAIPIFLGTQESSEDDMALGDIRWADDTKAAALTAAIAKVVPAAADKTTALDVAKAISDANLSAENAEKLAKAIYEVLGTATGTNLTNGGKNEVPVGWYLVVDKTTISTATDPEKNDALNAAVLQFTRDITIETKTDAPSQEKKVKEDTTYTDNEGYNDVADYDIGEDVPFQITSKIPDISKYTKYEMTFTDTMSEGLTFNPDSIKVTIGDAEYDAEAIASNDNIILTNPDDQHFTVKLILKKQNTDKLSGTNTAIFVEDADIKIDFTAELNTNAVIGLPGNTNTSNLTYTSNPNATDEKDSTNVTPDDTVIVFTYELDVIKVDGASSSKTLKDAEFVLKNADGTKYLKIDANNKVSEWVDTKANASVLKSGADGKFIIQGLDEGTYKLEETKAPTGYNKLTDDITLVISAEYISNRQEWNDKVPAHALLDLDLTVNGKSAEGSVETGIVSTKVLNNEGSILPSTGGIGTTIFYIIGGLLVVGAGVILVTRRRMNEG
jgi:fimbrial isopeptide formation D2 family protein/LPXTG-motif cell wall-anchored protein